METECKNEYGWDDSNAMYIPSAADNRTTIRRRNVSILNRCNVATVPKESEFG